MSAIPLQEGFVWRPCLCAEIDPSDRPCIVCEVRNGSPMTERIFSDKKRHLVCWPFSIRNLHATAEKLGIKRCWFHGGRNPHYDIPKRRLAEIAAKTEVVDPRIILGIVKGYDPPMRRPQAGCPKPT